MEALAKTDTSTKDLYLVEIEKAQKERCNVLIPSSRLEGLSEYHVPVLDRVQLSPDTSQGDVYVQEQGNDKRDTKYAITKQGLMKLSVCAGIIWHPMETKVTAREKDYISFQAVGGVRKADGSPVFMKAEYDMDREVIEMELEELYQGKAEGYEKKSGQKGNEWWDKKSPAEKEAYVEKCIRRDFLQKWKHKMKLCESGAMTRVIRALLGLKSTYTKAELDKPFVVPRIVVKIDYSDPTVKAKLMDAAIRAQTGIYGGGSISEFPKVTLPHETVILDAETVDEEERGFNPEPEPEPEPEDLKAKFAKANKDGKVRIINDLIKRKGYSITKLARPIDEYAEEKLEPFFEHLVSLPDKPADDDIPL